MSQARFPLPGEAHQETFVFPDDPHLSSLIALASDPDVELAVGGAGLFVPELVLGPGNLSSETTARIRAHLVAVARVRTAPLHPSVAWNCLYFGYDPDVPGYDAATCADLDLPKVSPGDRLEALPVGALVEYSSGAKVDHREWAEVVYKEGQPAGALDDGLVRPEYSGAVGFPKSSSTEGAEPGGGQQAVLEELLVLDFAPFTPLDSRAFSWLERARTSEDRHYIDELGHIAVDAVYEPAEAAQSDDIDYFCDWMIIHHADLLAQGWLGAALSDPDNPEELLEALNNSVRSVQDVLERSDEFGCWGDYWYLRDEYEALVADRDARGGIADAGTLMTSLADVPRGKHVAYHPFSPRLVEVVGPELLTYARYARSVVFLSVMIAELLAQRASDGVLHIRGDDIVLRLDDRWLYGGTWRAERLDAASVCPLVGFDPTITIGLGASGEQDDRHTKIAVDPDDEVDVTPQDSAEVAPGGQPFYWSIALRPAHRNEQRLFVEPGAGIVPGISGGVVLRIEHQGDIVAAERAQDVSLSADGRWVSPVRFPLDFFDGIRLNCLAQPGGSVILASTEQLAEPVEIGGVVRYFAFDPAILDPRRPPRPEPKLADLALRTLDRHGGPMDLGDGGWRRLKADRIAQFIFGPDCGETGRIAVDNALGSVGDRVLVQWDPEGAWCHHSAQRAMGRFDGSGGGAGIFGGPSERLRSSFGAAEVRHRSQHRVVMHLRKLRKAEEAVPERQAAYKELRELAPNRRRLPETLPPGHTYVMGHTRGGHHA